MWETLNVGVYIPILCYSRQTHKEEIGEMDAFYSEWMDKLNYKRPEPTCLSGSSDGRLEHLSHRDLIVWSE